MQGEKITFEGACFDSESENKQMKTFLVLLIKVLLAALLCFSQLWLLLLKDVLLGV